MIYDILAGYYDDLVRDDEATKQWVDWIESYNPKKDFWNWPAERVKLHCSWQKIIR